MICVSCGLFLWNMILYGLYERKLLIMLYWLFLFVFLVMRLYSSMLFVVNVLVLLFVMSVKFCVWFGIICSWILSWNLLFRLCSVFLLVVLVVIVIFLFVRLWNEWIGVLCFIIIFVLVMKMIGENVMCFWCLRLLVVELYFRLIFLLIIVLMWVLDVIGI